MAGLSIRKGDTVKVITGPDKGRQGKVLRVFPKENRVIIEHVRMVKRHTRPNPQRQVKGGIAEHEAPISAANVMLMCPQCGPTRVGHLVSAEGKHLRACRKCKRTFE